MQKIGYEFREPALLRQALTHSSREGEANYERLEFLGDAVLELTVTDLLFRQFPLAQEGELTRRRARLVCQEALSGWARAQGLGACLRLGGSEQHSGGRDKDSILEDVVEAIIGAVYLDGGMESARRVVHQVIAARFNQMQAGQERVDPKTRLQELLQQKGTADIAYEICREEGPPHDRTFYARVLLDGCALGEGSGRSKKQAEQAAAAQALSRLPE